MFHEEEMLVPIKSKEATNKIHDTFEDMLMYSALV
jgi:hypothetical protein